MILLPQLLQGFASAASERTHPGADPCSETKWAAERDVIDLLDSAGIM